MTTAAVFGCTGAVGRHILNTLLDDESFTSIKTISRSLPKPQSSSSSSSPTSPTTTTTTTSKLEAFQESNTSKWAPMISTLSPKPSIVFNAVGTSRAAAGGIQQQWKIDHDLCIETARAAKEAGVGTFVFISSAGTRGLLYRYVPYSKMKVGVEDAIKEMGFETAIVLRPGMILGEREAGKARAPILEKVIGSVHWISPALQDAIGQDQKIIGRAAVAAARLAQERKAPSKYWVLEQADIIKYGRDGWKE